MTLWNFALSHPVWLSIWLPVFAAACGFLAWAVFNAFQFSVKEHIRTLEERLAKAEKDTARLQKIIHLYDSSVSDLSESKQLLVRSLRECSDALETEADLAGCSRHDTVLGAREVLRKVGA